jgi:hypothetical protein
MNHRLHKAKRRKRQLLRSKDPHGDRTEKLAKWSKGSALCHQKVIPDLPEEATFENMHRIHEEMIRDRKLYQWNHLT